MTAYENAVICCQSVSQLPFQAAAIGQSFHVKIDEESAAFDFPEGKSFFRAYALPKSERDYVIAVYSYLDGVFSGSENDSHIFYPVLMFLDENFKALRVIASDLMRYRPPGWWNKPARLEGRLIIPSAVGVRYLVIYTTPQLLGQRTTFSYGASTGSFISGNIAVPIREPASARRYPHSPFGDLEVEFRPVGDD